jgi:L-malate glycosyltransferase
MKVFMLGDGGSPHVQKWVQGLCPEGIEIGLFSLHGFEEKHYKGLSGFTILNNPPSRAARSVLSKLSYLKHARAIRSQLEAFQPDVMHAHYATSYGLLATKTHFKPLIISAWGSDVYDFPKTSLLHKRLLKNVLAKADLICSTSHCMLEETRKYTGKKIEVVPFGVNTALFKPADNVIAEKDEIVIGTIKSLEKKYGIDLLIKAFAEARALNPKKNLKLLIVGDGSKKAEYKKLCGTLGISDQVTFTGRIDHKDVAKYHQQIDIFVSLSVLDSESFGVSLVEAMSCGKPVVASSVAGFSEVLGNDGCGILVPKSSYKEAAAAITEFIRKPAFAKKCGAKARERVLQLYDWNKNLEQMISIYKLMG